MSPNQGTANIGVALRLISTGGTAQEGGMTAVWGVMLTAALAGSLTITGLVKADGSAQAWVIAAGQSGYQALPGGAAGTTGGGPLAWSYANADRKSTRLNSS